MNITQKLFSKPRIKVPIIFLAFLSLSFSKGTHNTIYFIQWIIDLNDGKIFELYHIPPYYQDSGSQNLTVPYPPFSLYVLTIIYKIIHLLILNETTAALLASNLCSVFATFATFYLLYFQKGRLNKTISPIWYILTPAVFLISPILGYQDSIMALSLILTVSSIEQNRFFLAGCTASTSIFSKQLAVMPLFAVFVVVLFAKDIKAICKIILSFAITSMTILIPFIHGNHLLQYFRSQSLASVHTMYSANNPNFPWLTGVLHQIYRDGLRLIPAHLILPVTIENSTLRELGYLASGCMTLFTILGWLYFWRFRRKTLKISPYLAAIVGALSYNLLNFGVHENHVFMVLPLLFACRENPAVKHIYLVMSTLLGSNLFLLSGMGQSFSQVSIFHNNHP